MFLVIQHNILRMICTGKEKFFLGMARRVGCSIWACPEKDRILQMVEERSFSQSLPQSCQLHVVPMRDLTHEVCYIELNDRQCECYPN